MSLPALTPDVPPRPTLVASAPPELASAGARTEFLRRAAQYELDPSGPVECGPLTVNTDTYSASVEGRPVELSPRQIELLGVFLTAPERVWSREILHWICWGDTTPSRRVDVQLCRIRAKVGLDLFRNIRDRGWTLQLA